MSDKPQRIPVCAPVFTGKERTYLLQAVARGWISSAGDFLARFEARFAQLCAVRPGAAGGRADVKLIEDAAEAAGSTVDGRPAGSLADAAIFSFFGNKTLTTGEGGAVATDDLALGARIKFLKNHGMDGTRRYYHPEL